MGNTASRVAHPDRVLWDFYLEDNRVYHEEFQKFLTKSGLYMMF